MDINGSEMTAFPAGPGGYPFLISIPHGGTKIPGELSGRIALSSGEVAYYSDPHTRRLFDFGNRVAACVTADVSRTAIDVNRSPLHLPPAYPDGVLKTVTVGGTPVYRPGSFPDEPLIHLLLLRYYFPFHIRIKNALEEGTIRIGFDCHSMLPENPPGKKNPGTARPLICLSNGGDRDGMPRPGKMPVTCPPEWMAALAARFSAEFGEGSVRLNDPFTGGFISRFHYRRHRIPWVQCEVNRCLYEAEDGSADSERIEAVREAVFWALAGFWGDMAGGE